MNISSILTLTTWCYNSLYSLETLDRKPKSEWSIRVKRFSSWPWLWSAAPADTTRTCAPFFPLHITYFCFSTFIPISSNLFPFLISIPPHFTPSVFFLSEQPLLHLSGNQTTAPQQTREHRNPLSTIVEIYHLGADVTSDLVGRDEERWERGGVLQYQGETRWG